MNDIVVSSGDGMVGSDREALVERVVHMRRKIAQGIRHRAEGMLRNMCFRVCHALCLVPCAVFLLVCSTLSTKGGREDSVGQSSRAWRNNQAVQHPLEHRDGCVSCWGGS